MKHRERNKGIPGKKKKIIIRIIVITLIVAVAAVLGFKFLKKDDNKDQKAAVQTSRVTRGDVELTISGSGTVEPNERYEIIPLVNGEIISCPYEVGDYVNEGDVVYTFDKTDAELSLRKQQNSMESSTMSYNKTKDEAKKLTVKAKGTGTIRDITVKKGEKVKANQQIATIVNDKIMEVELPFNAEQLKSIAVGDMATISSSALMSTMNGTVTHIDSAPTAHETGAAMYNVTVEFENPGGITKDAMLGGAVNGQISGGSGKAQYTYEGTVTTEIEGTVESINFKNGDYINNGDTVVRLSSSELSNTLRNNEITYENAKLAMEDQMNKLDDYSVTSPISGTVITKNSKAGDTIDRTNSSVTMMVIADISKLKFTLPIDELDVSKVSVGQEVKITSDAVEGKEFIGYITEMAMEGSSSNGVTTYEAKVTIDNPGELKPSMNVDAVIVVESAQNVLRVNTSDIKTARGKSYVFVKAKDGSEDKNKAFDKNGNMPDMNNMPSRENFDPEKMKQYREAMQGGEKKAENTAKPVGENPSGEKTSGNGMPGQGMPQGGGQRQMMPQAPEGFTTVEIEIGVQGDEFTEVKSGLNEFDEIYRQETSSGGNNFRFGGMSGGMGRMPSGGMSGGMGRMPSGGMAGGMRR